nr:immunoglobulin heavy chain junction region [Mus musculus]MBK4197551.1 immunoglobulin heavy chain junction region [Mus musculus]MBK4197552.1 immunoglobulin heavy chain junction region [Mus musculus]MBK4197553.1 immunoglobulin heavy chain junction region [Mus musculus]MBK4197554.1 immunoglobulin heavy chain junction region [Mus musculus]
CARQGNWDERVYAMDYW